MAQLRIVRLANYLEDPKHLSVEMFSVKASKENILGMRLAITIALQTDAFYYMRDQDRPFVRYQEDHDILPSKGFYLKDLLPLDERELMKLRNSRGNRTIYHGYPIHTVKYQVNEETLKGFMTLLSLTNQNPEDFDLVIE